MSKKELPIKFRIKGIKTDEFAIIEDTFNKNNPSIQYRIGTSFLIPESEIIVCSTSFTFAQNETPFLKVKASCAFEINKDSWNNTIGESEHEAILPVLFTDHIIMLTLGTLRGILHTKTEGTQFNSLIIPTINITDLRDDVETLSIPLSYKMKEK